MSEVLDVWKVSNESHNRLWTYYIAVTSAVLGFSFSETFITTTPVTAKIGLLVLLIAFLLSNLISIRQNLRTYNAAIAELRAINSETSLGRVATSMHPISITLLTAFHILIDACATTTLASRIPLV